MAKNTNGWGDRQSLRTLRDDYERWETIVDSATVGLETARQRLFDAENRTRYGPGPRCANKCGRAVATEGELCSRCKEDDDR